MTRPALVVDAETTIAAWCTSQGLPADAEIRRSGAYVRISRIGGTPEGTTGLPDHPRITAEAHGSTAAQARKLAIDFANLVQTIAVGSTQLNDAITCIGVDVDSGPTAIPDASGQSRYSVETTWHLGPTS